MNIYGSTGLGAAGTGEPSGGIIPGTASSPDALAALQQMLGIGAVSSRPSPPVASAAPQKGVTTPMASFIGAGAPGASPMSMSGAQMAQQQPAPQPQNMGQPIVQTGQQGSGTPNNTLALLQFLQQLRRSPPQRGINQ